MASISEVVQIGHDMFVAFPSWLHSIKLNCGQHFAQGEFKPRDRAGASDSVVIWIQYYWAALSTILFYDYFLTLRDEVC